jgi:hypothetical protein
MAFEGGPLSVLGIKPEGLVNLGTSAVSGTVSQAVGQVWQGSGQSFIGQAGQAIAGNLAGAAVNVALNSAFGTSVAGAQGLPLDSGANLLATVVTPQVTGAIAAGINQQLQQTLRDAGPFGSLLSDIGGGLVNQALNGITNSITGGAIAGGSIATVATGENYKMFPGGGGEGEIPADYGGSSYTLTDVVFSLRRANQGPQAFGDLSYGQPLTQTTLPWGTLNGDVFGVGSPDSVDAMKKAIGQGNFESDLTNLSGAIG